MRNALLSIVASLALAASAPAQEAAAPHCKTCGQESYGTAIEWAGSPSEAATRAKEAKKLVFVLHVSGYFEDANFT